MLARQLGMMAAFAGAYGNHELYEVYERGNIVPTPKVNTVRGCEHGFIEQMLGHDIDSQSRQVRRQHARLLKKRIMRSR